MSEHNTYLDAETVREMRVEAARRQRSISWVAQRAWVLARARIRALPSEAAPTPLTGGTSEAEL